MLGQGQVLIHWNTGFLEIFSIFCDNAGGSCIQDVDFENFSMWIAILLLPSYDENSVPIFFQVDLPLNMELCAAHTKTSGRDTQKIVDI